MDLPAEVHVPFARWLRPIDGILSRIENILVLLAGLLVILLMFYGTADVIARAAFNRPLPSTYEYMELGMVAIVYLGVSHVQHLQAHVGVDMASKHFPRTVNKVLAVIGCLFGLLLMGTIGWWGAMAAWESYRTSEYIGSVARVQVLPARLALLVGVSVLFLRLLMETADHIIRLVRRR